MAEKPTVPAVCECCGKDFLTYKTSLKKGMGKYCSHKCASAMDKRQRPKGKDHANWKGGKIIEKRNGYVVLTGVGRPNPFEHRYVMEQHLGRKLARNEVIHHINGIKTDNRIENLEILHPNVHSQLHADKKRNGLWAAGHEHCVKCKRTIYKHAGRGLCRSCYACQYKKKRKHITPSQVDD